MSGVIARFGSILRAIFIALWVCIVAGAVLSYLAYPQEFTAAKIAEYLKAFEGEIWAVYLVISILRGFTLLPSTPLVIAGTLLFPSQPWAVLAVSVLGIVLSSTMIYFFSELLGFSEYFENHRPELTRRIKARLEHPAGFLFVAAWAFFPLVPTDLVCYLAGSMRMQFWKFILAIAVGETILCACYIFLGGTLISHFR